MSISHEARIRNDRPGVCGNEIEARDGGEQDRDGGIGILDDMAESRSGRSKVCHGGEEARNDRLKAGEGDREARDARAVAAYGAATAACVLLSVVYAQFSHGVSSPFMTFLAAVPLVGGVVVFLAMVVTSRHSFDRVSFNAYHAGVATLVVACALQGVFDIAGTASPFVGVFVAVGAVLVAFAWLRSLIVLRHAF